MSSRSIVRASSGAVVRVGDCSAMWVRSSAIARPGSSATVRPVMSPSSQLLAKRSICIEYQYFTYTVDRDKNHKHTGSRHVGLIDGGTGIARADKRGNNAGQVSNGNGGQATEAGQGRARGGFGSTGAGRGCSRFVGRDGRLRTGIHTPKGKGYTAESNQIFHWFYAVLVFLT